jgi:hypothetical protein
MNSTRNRKVYRREFAVISSATADKILNKIRREGS